MMLPYVEGLLTAFAVACVLKIGSVELTHCMKYLHISPSLLKLREMVEWESELALVTTHYVTN